MRISISIVAILGSLLTGCAADHNVRYVYQDKDFGVVGMPENTDRWPTHYRHRAEKLMDEHFPEGHEIIRAEEVDAGSRTVKVEGSRTAELGPQLPAEVLKVAKFGHSASRTQSDVMRIKECRIVYRRHAGSKEPGYSPDVAANPVQYLDPNEEARKKLDDAVAKKDQQESDGDAQHRDGEPETSGKHRVAQRMTE